MNADVRCRHCSVDICNDFRRRLKDIKPFHYSHQGSLAYIGSEKAVADVAWLNGNVATGGKLTYLFWRSAYLSMCFSSELPLFFPFYALVGLVRKRYH